MFHCEEKKLRRKIRLTQQFHGNISSPAWGKLNGLKRKASFSSFLDLLHLRDSVKLQKRRKEQIVKSLQQTVVIKKGFKR